MTRARPLRRLRRPFGRAVFLAATLAAATIAGLTATPAFAQNAPAAPAGEEKAEGRPLDGYLATGCLVGLALFLVGKSARR